MTMTVLVCGGRKFGKLPKNYTSLRDSEKLILADRMREFKFIHNTLTNLSIKFHVYGDYSKLNEPEDAYGNWMPDWRVVTGGATGTDDAAIEWAVVNWCDFEEYPADWERHGKSAGSIRNQYMLYYEQPDVVVAFPGGPGTRDMVRKAKRAGVQTIEVEYNA